MKLALTGGPSGGKTSLADLLQKEFSDRVLIVPEAASLLFSGGFPRLKSQSALLHRQKAIYYVQRELEELLAEENPGFLLVCDRGGLDGTAYWPHDKDHFVAAVGSTMDQELERYDWVIHLDTAPHHFYDLTNPIRTESYDEALKLNQKAHGAWGSHAQRFVINNTGHFVDKLYRSTFVVENILAGKTFQEINKALEIMQK